MCGEILSDGRSDKVFCSVKCKSKYNYQKSLGFKNYRQMVIDRLDVNYKILDALLKANVLSIDSADLAVMGFRFECVTFFRKTRRHSECRCYDIKYNMTSSRVFKISRVPMPMKIE